MWGGRFADSPDAVMEEINVSIDFDRHLYRQDIAASKAHAAMLAKQGIITTDDAAEITQGLDTILSEIEGGTVHLQSRARRHPHERGEPARRADRAGGRPAAHRALAQRPGGDRLPALGARHHRRPRRRARRLSAGAGREGAGPRRDRDAGLHPSADRAAGDLRPSPPGLCRDGGARPRPLRRCARAPERMPARRGGARRHVVSDRPRHDGEGARLRPADGELARCRLRPRFRPGDAVGGGDHGRASVAFRRGDRDLELAAERASCCCRIGSPPAPRSCRRSAIRTPPSWCAPRLAASSARSPRCSW